MSAAVAARRSVRAFRPDPVPATLLRTILEAAHRAPSGGNLQPWRVYALAGEPLLQFKAKASSNLIGETPEYDIYPPELWEPFRTRRFVCGEDLYAALNISREDKQGRLRQLSRNVEFFGAPVGLFFSLDRKLGKPQWADLGMYMQTLMLLAVENGLATCPQEYWARYPNTVADFVGLPTDHILFAGMALGWPDDAAPVNALRTRREPFDVWCTMIGFEKGQGAES